MDNLNYDFLKSSISKNKINDLMFVLGLEKLANTPQDNYYHAEGDVWIHTKMVCDELFNHQDFLKASDDEKFVLFYSCLLHDVSKPLCTKIDENGKITSKGHSKKGAIDSRLLLWKADVPFDLRERICNIIANHQVPFFAFNNQERSPEFLARYLSWQLNLNELIIVSECDMSGRNFVEKQKYLDDLTIFKEIAKEDNCLYEKKDFISVATRMKYFNSMGAIDAQFDLFKEYGSEVVVLVGSPASGKDTWVSKNSNNRPVISFDDEVYNLKLNHNENIGKAIHNAIDKAKDLLRKKENFIFNATHLSLQMRKKTIDLIHSYNGWVKIIYLEPKYNELLDRNKKRNSTLNNKKLEEMLLKLEVPTAIEAEEIKYINTSMENKKGYKL